MTELQVKEVFLKDVDINCWCKFGPEDHTICGNCMTNDQIAKKKGLYYDDGKFFKKRE